MAAWADFRLPPATGTAFLDLNFFEHEVFFVVFLATLGANDIWLFGTQNGNTSLYGLLCGKHRALYLKYSAFGNELDLEE